MTIGELENKCRLSLSTKPLTGSDSCRGILTEMEIEFSEFNASTLEMRIVRW
jgi:hypothetical protein